MFGLGLAFLIVGPARKHAVSQLVLGPCRFRVRTSVPVVALTFDDGPDPLWTPSIIRILKMQHVPATFFLVGQNVVAHPEIAREERDGQFEIGNHSWDHVDMTSLSRAAIDRELDQTQDAILRAAQLRPILFRPPYGHRNFFVAPAARNRHLEVVLWSMSPWHGPHPTAADLVSHTLQECEPGSIILLHDSRGDRSQIVEALPAIISGLRSKGYRFLTVSQLEQYDR